jgi:hypothetical protein
MATYTATVVPDCQTIGSFDAWASAISAAFAALGWVQANDTGQVVFVASVMTANITGVALVSGTTYRYTYTAINSGPALRVGMSLTITGMIDAGNNTAGAAGGVTVISSLAGGAGTFDVVNANGVVKAGNTGSGTTTALAAPPGTSTTVYEIWQTSDSVGFPISVKAEYGTGGVNNRVAIFMTMGTGSNGSGTIANPGTRTGTLMTINSATALACHFSGDGGRMVMNLFHGQGQISLDYIFSLERSYDTSGTPIGSYYTMLAYQGNEQVGRQQTLFPSGASTTQEILGLCAPIPKSAASGNVGSTTHIAPVFPLVGGLGNPLTNVLAFRATDFADNQVVYETIYGVQHTYITDGFNQTAPTSTAVAAGLMTRYD